MKYLSVIFFAMALAFSSGCLPVGGFFKDKYLVFDATQNAEIFIDPAVEDFSSIRFYSSSGEKIRKIRFRLSFFSKDHADIVFSEILEYPMAISHFPQWAFFEHKCSSTEMLILPVRIYPIGSFSYSNPDRPYVFVSEKCDGLVGIKVEILDVECPKDLRICFSYVEPPRGLSKLFCYVFGARMGGTKARYYASTFAECLSLWDGIIPVGSEKFAALCYTDGVCVFQGRVFNYSDLLAHPDVSVLYFYRRGTTHTIKLPANIRNVIDVEDFDSTLPSRIKRWTIVPDKRNRILL